MNAFSELLLRRAGAISAGLGTDCSEEWMAGRSILTYGVRIGIRTNSPQLLDRMCDHLPPVWKPASSPYVDRLFSLKIGDAGPGKPRKPLHELFEDSEPGTTSESLSELLSDFERRIKMYVAEMARRRVFIHAGAVGWRGKAIIVPGRTLSGKSTLVAELVRCGAVYYSDEYAVLDEKGRVLPYPQRLAIRIPGSSEERKYRPEEIGGASGTKPLPVGLVVVGRFKAGRHWRPRRLTAGAAVLELLDNCLPARRKPEAVMSALQYAVSEAAIYKGPRGEAGETAPLILRRCDLDHSVNRGSTKMEPE